MIQLDKLEHKKIKTYIYIKKSTFQALRKKALDLGYTSISNMFDSNYNNFTKEIKIYLDQKKNDRKKIM